MVAARDLQVVVEKSDRTKCGCRDNGDPHVQVVEPRPQERGAERRRQDEQPTHRRRAGFGAMAGGTFLTNHLTNLKFPQLGDQPRSKGDADDKGRDTRRRRSERDVLNDIQHRQPGVKRVQKVVEHCGYTTPELLRLRPSASRATATSSKGRTSAPTS